jgi:fucose permease
MTFARPDLVPVTISAAFVVGMLLALLGSIKLPLARRLQISEAKVGGLLSALFLAIGPMMLVSGILIDRWGVAGVLIASALICGVALSGLALCRNYASAVGAVAAVGVAVAGLSTASGVLMPEAFFPGRPAASLQIGNVFFGLGALLTPALTERLIRKLSYRKALFVLALIALAPAVTAALPQQFPGGHAPAGGLAAVLSSPFLWLVGLAFLLYVPLESGISTWATTCLTELGMREKRAAVFLSGFWLTFLAARLAVAFLELGGVIPAWADSWLLIALALATGMALGSLAGAVDAIGAGGRVLLVGAFLGPIFPGLVAILFGHFPDHKGTAYGAMFCVGSVGNLVLPPLFGSYARKTSVQRAIRLTPVVAAALAAATLLLSLWPKD